MEGRVDRGECGWDVPQEPVRVRRAVVGVETVGRENVSVACFLGIQN